MARIKLTLVKSKIDRPKKQKATLEALGLTKINGTAEHETNDQILGMVAKVKHLITVEEL